MKRKFKKPQRSAAARHALPAIDAAINIAISKHPLDRFLCNLAHGMLVSAIDKTPKTVFEEMTCAATKTAKEFGAVELSAEEAAKLTG